MSRIGREWLLMSIDIRSIKLYVFVLIFLSSVMLSQQKVDKTYFNDPYIDVDEWRSLPIKHRYVHGGFKGTDTRFSFYFPEKKKYRGHFFQYITPAPDNENLSQLKSGEEDILSFTIANGAYFIETNGGGKPTQNSDPLIGSYLANAAVAKYSKKFAENLYGTNKTYGYAFGGSGGAYRTIGGIENTEGAWEGVVPFVPGSPMAIPNVFSVRMHAMRILDGKFAQIVDALEPGSNVSMYADLDPEESDALREVTKMGFPPQSWFGYKTMGVHGFSAVYGGMVAADPSYFKDFWEKPGYLGYRPPSSLLKSRVQQTSHIKKSIYQDEAIQTGLIPKPVSTERGTADAAWKGQGQNEDGKIAVAFQLEGTLPEVRFLGGDLNVLSGDAKGKTVPLTKIDGDKVVIGLDDLSVVELIKAGDEVRVDNSNFLAAQTYHRHQVPGKEYKVWDQFRNRDGEPIYPQRQRLLAPSFTKAAAGVLPTGKFKGKMILLASLWDREAFPWNADWYATQVKNNLKEKTDEHFRLWFTDRALHGDTTVQEDPTRTVSYLGVLQQALLDLSDWVERGIVPALSTEYSVEDGQVIAAPSAKERKGLQPLVFLNVEVTKRVDREKNAKLKFYANIQVPEESGKIVKVEWNFEGEKKFSKSRFSTDTYNDSKAYITHKFKRKGTFFPTVKVYLQRDGNRTTPFTQIQNLDRVRVVIR